MARVWLVLKFRWNAHLRIGDEQQSVTYRTRGDASGSDGKKHDLVQGSDGYARGVMQEASEAVGKPAGGSSGGGQTKRAQDAAKGARSRKAARDVRLLIIIHTTAQNYY